MIWDPFFGAVPIGGATRFRVWATAPRDVRLHLTCRGGTTIHQPLRSTAGVWEIEVPAVDAGAHYAYSLDGGEPRPDPASRFQPDGVHGWSEVIDPRRFQWTDETWRGLDPATVVLARTPLHAAALRIPHPRGRGWLWVESPLPDDIARCLDLLRAARRLSTF